MNSLSLFLQLYQCIINSVYIDWDSMKCFSSVHSFKFLSNCDNFGSKLSK